MTEFVIHPFLKQSLICSKFKLKYFAYNLFVEETGHLS